MVTPVAEVISSSSLIDCPYCRGSKIEYKNKRVPCHYSHNFQTENEICIQCQGTGCITAIAIIVCSHCSGEGKVYT